MINEIASFRWHVYIEPYGQQNAAQL